MNLSENARRVLEARYLRRDAQGRINETPDQFFARVARAMAHAELLLGNREQPAFWDKPVDAGQQLLRVWRGTRPG